MLLGRVHRLQKVRLETGVWSNVALAVGWRSRATGWRRWWGRHGLGLGWEAAVEQELDPTAFNPIVALVVAILFVRPCGFRPSRAWFVGTITLNRLVSR